MATAQDIWVASEVLTGRANALLGVYSHTTIASFFQCSTETGALCGVEFTSERASQ